MYTLETAAASVVGQTHREGGRNNQDAYLIAGSIAGTDYSVGVVSDGCGSTAHSEVGSYLIVRLFMQRVEQLIQTWDTTSCLDSEQLNKILADVANQLHTIAYLARTEQQSPDQVILDAMLSTLVAVVVGPINSHFIVIGDGIVTINGVIMEFDDGEGAPPYLGYSALSHTDYHRPIQELPVRLLDVPTSQLENFIIASDGMLDLIKGEGQLLPGSKRERVKSISTLWEEDKYFANPDMLRRYLAKVNRDVTKLDRSSQELQASHGLLSDDTTMIVGRLSRAPREE